MLDIRLVTFNSECWINKDVDIDYPIMKRSDNLSVKHEMDLESELSFLEMKNLLNEPIYVMPHRISKLRSFVIEKHLTENGFIDESCLGNIYDVVIDGCKFCYRITKCKEKVYAEEDLIAFESSRKKIEEQYDNFINTIYGL